MKGIPENLLLDYTTKALNKMFEKSEKEFEELFSQKASTETLVETKSKDSKQDEPKLKEKEKKEKKNSNELGEVTELQEGVQNVVVDPENKKKSLAVLYQEDETKEQNRKSMMEMVKKKVDLVNNQKYFLKAMRIKKKEIEKQNILEEMKEKEKELKEPKVINEKANQIDELMEVVENPKKDIKRDYFTHPETITADLNDMNYKKDNIPQYLYYIGLKKNFYQEDTKLHYIPYLGDDDDDNSDPINIDIISNEEFKKLQKDKDPQRPSSSSKNTMETINHLYCARCKIFDCQRHGVESIPKVERDIIQSINISEVKCTGECSAKDGVNEWNTEEKRCLLFTLPISRNPCLISENILTKSCSQVQKEIKRLVDRHGKFSLVHVIRTSWKDVSKSKQYHPTDYVPCQCVNGCTDQCPCFSGQNFCHKWCGCPSTCKNRVEPCKCKGPCNNNCPCFSSYKECDPDLCKCPKGCNNKKLTQYNSKFIGLGISLVHGWGAFILEKAEKGDFLCEYVGEVISQSEASKRDKIYSHKKNLNFLFDLTKDSTIDSYVKGNKARFLNHSKDPNCEAKVIFADGDWRIGIYAKRNLELGEELTFTYVQDEKRKFYWMK